jgi:hypothetical protein
VRTRKQRAADTKLGVMAAILVVFVVGLGVHVENQARLRSSAAMPQRDGQSDRAAQHHAQPSGAAPATRRGGAEPEHDERADPKRKGAGPNDQPASDPVETWSAAVTAAFTIVLAIVAVRQANISAAQARIGLAQARIARSQASIARGTLRETAVAAAAAKTAADAAKLQARAAVASELAEIKLVQMDLVVSPLLPGQSEVVIPPGPLPSRALVSPIFLNAGRTRCRIVEFCIEWRVLSREAPGVNIDIVGDPEYRDIFRNDVIFYPDQPLRMTWRIGNNFEVNLTEEQVALIARNDAWLWVWGYVAYANFIQEVHEVGFAAHWEAVADATFPKSGHPAPRGMVIEGPPQFVFDRQRNT